MPRSTDLDTIAPDDSVVSSPPPVIKKSKKKKHHPAPSSRIDYRQKITQILGHTTNPLSSFLVNPKVFSFQEKDDEEQILLVLRPHWFTNVSWITITLILLSLPTFFGSVFYYLVTFIYAFEKFLGWYFNVFIITDERVVDIDFNNLLVKKFSEAKLSMIQDVTSKVIGFFPTILNYGHVLIQTASEVPEIDFNNVPNPEKIIKALQQLRQEEEQETLEGRVR